MSNKDKTKFVLNNIPKSNDLWKGIGGNYQDFTQILNEFIDNSISNFLKYDQAEVKRIIIRVIQTKKDSYKVQIEDTGAGIKDLESAFTIGSKRAQVTFLNEHGFGMKQALAAANPENNNWSVETRTLDNQKNNEHYEIKAPYDISKQEVFKIQGSKSWKGIHPTGTIVTFDISESLFKTITNGLRGNYKKLNSMMNILAEDLGYVYRTYIHDKKVSITLAYQSLDMEDMVTQDILEVKPVIYGTFGPNDGKGTDGGKGTIGLGEGYEDIEIDYEFYKVEKSDNKKYYLANMATSGVEIQINGRFLVDNLFTEIWGIEKHNSYNHILIRLNIKSDFPDKLPSTVTNKTGLKQDDPILEKIYSWLRGKISEPKKEANLITEAILLDELKVARRIQLLEEKDSKSVEEKDSKSVKEREIALVQEREKAVFLDFDERLRVDYYESYESYGPTKNNIVIYEGKKDKTTPKDVYQLLMYWDGLTMDGITVNKAILVSAYHPKSVRAIVKLKNQTEYEEKKKYVIELRTWEELYVNYPR